MKKPYFKGNSSRRVPVAGAPNAVKGCFDFPGSVSMVLIDMMLPASEEISKKYFSNHRSSRQLIFGRDCNSLPRWIPFGPTGYSFSVEDIKAEIIRLLNEIIADTNWFHFVNRRQSIHIPFDEILFFQSDLRYIDIFDIHGRQTRILAKLDDIEKTGLSPFFLRVHKSYLVGKRYIRSISYSEHIVFLSSGEKIPVSQNYYSLVKTWETSLDNQKK